jgi:hypothetical protein
MEKYFIKVPGTELYVHASRDAMPQLILSEGNDGPGIVKIEESQFEEMQSRLRMIYQGKMELIKVPI